MMKQREKYLIRFAIFNIRYLTSEAWSAIKKKMCIKTTNIVYSILLKKIINEEIIFYFYLNFYIRIYLKI